MEGVVEFSGRVAQELKDALLDVKENEAQRLVIEIEKAPRIFIAGAGRCLLMLRAFAMRLMHLGYEVYVVGDTTTPAIQKNDLLLLGTGAGVTGSLEYVAKKAKGYGAVIGVITILPDSPIGQLGDFHVVIPGRTSDCGGVGTSIQPGGGKFEQGMLIFLDSVIAKLGEMHGFDLHSPYARHTNLE